MIYYKHIGNNDSNTYNDRIFTPPKVQSELDARLWFNTKKKTFNNKIISIHKLA